MVSLNAQNLTLVFLMIFLLSLPRGIELDYHYRYPAAVFNFGDSNSDTGDEVATGLGHHPEPPYGQTYFQKPGGRFCDGRLIIDFLMDAMGLPFLNPYLEAIGAPSFRKGCNFAAAEATMLLPLHHLSARFRSVFKWLSSSDSRPKLRISSIRKLYKEGARNFWIHNTGPHGCLPKTISEFGSDLLKLDEIGCVISQNQASRLFNLQLHALCKKLHGQYPDANVTYVDIFTIKSNLIANYSRYGFEQHGGPPLNFDDRVFCSETTIVDGILVTAKGCNDSSKYVSWDWVHYTEAANQHVASQILTGKYSDPPVFGNKIPSLLKLRF